MKYKFFFKTWANHLFFIFLLNAYFYQSVQAFEGMELEDVASNEPEEQNVSFVDLTAIRATHLPLVEIGKTLKQGTAVLETQNTSLGLDYGLFDCLEGRLEAPLLLNSIIAMNFSGIFNVGLKLRYYRHKNLFSTSLILKNITSIVGTPLGQTLENYQLMKLAFTWSLWVLTLTVNPYFGTDLVPILPQSLTQDTGVEGALFIEPLDFFAFQFEGQLNMNTTNSISSNQTLVQFGIQLRPYPWVTVPLTLAQWNITEFKVGFVQTAAYIGFQF